MRRDICFIFPVDVATLYNAYLTAASNDRFRRECAQEPYHTLSFGLNFSMKYNFNGGACTLRFMPINGGSAVNMRFAIAQLAGARYERYAKDLTEAAGAVIGVMGAPANIDVEEFLKPANQVTPQATHAAPAPAPVAAPTPAPSPAPAPNKGKFCTKCGQNLPQNALFCSSCGNKLDY